MARKSLGFVPLIWECPFCDTQNPGPIKTCTSCGAPQPDDVEFLQVDEAKFNFIKDEALIRMAKAGPDIHCPYCGTRNPSTAELCSNCGGEISRGGKARKAGNRVRTVAETKQPLPSPTAEAKQPRPARYAIIAVIAVLAILACVIVVILLIFKTDEVNATVSGVKWERSIAVEEFTTVTASDWWNEIPEGAEVQSCSEEYRYTSDEPQANATEVCGEEHVEDTGTGIGEVVQDCTYEVYDDYCEFTVMEWTVVETLTETGDDLSPDWPEVTLTTDQREGERSEDYTITFSDNGKTYTYTTTDVELFLQASPGSHWTLEVSKLGGVQSANPSN
jgi:predicted nucleic acid-binding Zn ribbon protein